MNTWIGEALKISIFGESHGMGIGCVIDGLKSGLIIDLKAISAELALRKPASGNFTTPRTESDDFTVISGVTSGKTNGSPLCVIFYNTDTRRSDYNSKVPRPGHADFAAYVKHNGNCDLSGGGHFSARLTAPLVFCGAICKAFLESKGIFTASAITSIGDFQGKTFYDADITKQLLCDLQTDFPLIDESEKQNMLSELKKAKETKDSVGGCVQCCCINLPIGLGEPFFNSVESAIAKLAFSIPAVKGIEFGRGFELARMRASQANDEYNAQAVKNRLVNMNRSENIAYNNNAGGIIGGLTNSMPLIFKVAFKPIPSIGQVQRSVDMQSYEPVIVRTEGRHDVCAAVRGACVVKSIACLCIYDFLCGEAK